MNGLENKYIIKNNKRLRYGYTTGSCAAGAASGAVRMLLSGRELSEVTLPTPKGITLTLALHDIIRGDSGGLSDTEDPIMRHNHWHSKISR